MTNAELVNLKERAKRTYYRTSITATETIRSRLQMTMAEFSIALGYSDHSYAGWLRDGEVPQVVHLAAECLARRQAPNADQVWLTRNVKGSLVSTPIDVTRTMVLDGKTYWLVESK